jgi:hypothetical protein
MNVLIQTAASPGRRMRRQTAHIKLVTEWVNHKITKVTQTAILVNTITRHHQAWEAVQNAVWNVRHRLTGPRCPAVRRTTGDHDWED